MKGEDIIQIKKYFNRERLRIAQRKIKLIAIQHSLILCHYTISYKTEEAYDYYATQIYNLENDEIRINNIIKGISVIQKHLKSLHLPPIQRGELRRRMLNNLLADNQPAN